MNDAIGEKEENLRRVAGKDADGVKRILNFVSTVPADHSHFFGWTFEEDVDFSCLVFEGDADFSSARFKRRVNFDQVLFRGSVVFKGAVFEKNEEFDHDQRVSFDYCRFGENLELLGSRTQKQNHRISFEFAKFNNQGDVGFHHAHFLNRGDVSFDYTRFRNSGNVSFDHAQFLNQRDVSLSYSQFHNQGEVSFGGTQVYNAGHFDFSHVQFMNEHSLSLGSLSFRDDHEINFDHCLFWPKENCDFRKFKAPSNGQLRFTKCFFARARLVDFSNAHFHRAVFEGGTFDPLNIFGESDFTSYLKTFPNDRKDVDALTERIHHKVKEKGEYFCEVFDAGVEVDFRGISSESAKNLTFRLTNLSGAVFDGLTLSDVQLNSPRWGEYQGRFALHQEIKARAANGEMTEDELRDVSDQCTQLKINLKRQGHYRPSGKFHFSEQELARECARNNKQWGKYFFLSLYRKLSGYGEEPFVAIAWFLGLVTGFSLWIAFISTDFSAVPYEGWEWFKHGTVKFFRTGLSLIIPFQGPGYDALGLQNFWEYIFRFVAQVWILAIQLPLMVLAIHRWFKS